MQISVNEGMVQMKMLKARYMELRHMRDQSLVREETSYYSMSDQNERKTVKDPQYDAVALDEKIVDIELAIHEIDSKIKASNAVTQIEVARDIKELLTPLKAKV